jgi:acetyl-CoA C-acetyltransferase
MAESIVIVGAKRTPIGSMQGKFNSMSASQLGAVAIKAAVEQAGVKPTEVDDVIFGNVLSAGQGQAPRARPLSARDWTSPRRRPP